MPVIYSFHYKLHGSIPPLHRTVWDEPVPGAEKTNEELSNKAATAFQPDPLTTVPHAVTGQEKREDPSSPQPSRFFIYISFQGTARWCCSLQTFTSQASTSPGPPEAFGLAQPHKGLTGLESQALFVMPSVGSLFR